jgi:hypothetical protein
MSDRLLSALADSPEWLLHHLDFSKKEAEFVAMNRRSYELSSFMDERLVRASSKRELVRWSKLSAEVPIKSRPRLCFMFHSAYCCSTLFAKCVDWAGKILSYREPQILLEIALQKPGLPNSHYQDKSNGKRI